MEIKNVVFDFGNVLLKTSPKYLYNKIFEDKERMDFFLREVCNPEWNSTLDAGKKYKHATEELAQTYPEFREEIIAHDQRFEEMILGEIIENTELISKLKENYRVFGLTNWPYEKYEVIKNKYSFINNLEGVVVSGREGVIKPNPEIYNILINRYAVNPTQSVFIDDLEDNVRTASEFGFQTILYNLDCDLKSELVGLGIII